MATLLSVNNYFYRRDGSEAIYQDHNRLLEKTGWNVVPFAMHHPDNPESPWSDYFVEEIEFGRSYSLLQKLSRLPKVVWSLEAQRKLSRLLDRVRPDIAHCHTIYHHLSPSILGVLRRAGIPVVMTLHDLKLACPAYHMFVDGQICEACKGGRIRQVVARRCIKGSLALSSIVMIEAVTHRLLRSYEANVQRFISPCRYYIDKLVEWGWHREHFVHVPNFVDTDELRPDFLPGSAILYFGRLSPEKGLVGLIQAAARAGVPLRIAGDGPQRPELEAEVDRTGADVAFLGRLSGDVLHDEIRRARATVLPAQWYENAPMSILESYALGKPVIAAAIGGIPELVKEGHTGWMYASTSVDELAAHLRRVMDLPDATVADMGRQARAHAEEQYSAPVYRQRILDLYARIGVAACHS